MVVCANEGLFPQKKNQRKTPSTNETKSSGKRASERGTRAPEGKIMAKSRRIYSPVNESILMGLTEALRVSYHHGMKSTSMVESQKEGIEIEVEPSSNPARRQGKRLTGATRGGCIIQDH